ncbi:hypothetical protein ACSBR1_013437 [Camellia fascicularis]
MVNDKGQNILHVAVQNENTKAIKFILENSLLSSLINHKDIDGNTPLHLVVPALNENQLIYNKRVDMKAFNKENQTPIDVMTQYENETLVNQVFNRSELENGGCSLGWRNVISNDNENLTKKMKAHDELKSWFHHAWWLRWKPGPKSGMAILTRETAFKAFAITNTIAMTLSTSAVVFYFFGTPFKDRDKLLNHYNSAANLIMVTIVTMALASIIGTYVVLEHSQALAIAVYVTGCLLFWIFNEFLGETFKMAIELLPLHKLPMLRSSHLDFISNEYQRMSLRAPNLYW